MRWSSATKSTSPYTFCEATVNGSKWKVASTFETYVKAKETRNRTTLLDNNLFCIYMWAFIFSSSYSDLNGRIKSCIGWPNEVKHEHPTSWLFVGYFWYDCFSEIRRLFDTGYYFTRADCKNLGPTMSEQDDYFSVVNSGNTSKIEKPW